MMAIGHITLGYIIGNPLNRASDHSLNIPALWTLSMLPDVDLLIPGLQHRGPTHSLIFTLIVSLLLIIIGSRKAVPYIAALATHSMIGDYFTDGGIMLFWPFTSEWVKYENAIRMGSTFETYVELALFLILILTLIVSKDFNSLFNADRMNILFFIPLCIFILPFFLPTVFSYPVNIPEILVIPHLILMSMMALAFTVSLVPAGIRIDDTEAQMRAKKKPAVKVLDEDEYIKKLEQLEREKRELQAELQKLKRKPEGKIGYILLILGFGLIGLAIYYEHNVSAFIGIALTFWGALLLYIKPTRFIRKEILDSTVVQPLKDLHKLLDDLGFQGTSIYVSPRTLRGLRSATIYIPKSDQSKAPSDEQLSREETFMKNPEAIKLNPPGLGLSSLLEDELKTNFSAVGLEYLQYNLEKALVEGLEIAEAFDMDVSGSTVRVEMRGSIFDEIIGELDELDAHRRIGDPFTSAIACILARSTGSPIIIEKVERDPKKKSTNIIFKMENSTSEKEMNQS